MMLLVWCSFGICSVFDVFLVGLGGVCRYGEEYGMRWKCVLIGWLRKCGMG